VPAAFGILATHPDDPWAACLAAASLGGDSDTIAAMAGAIGGACLGLRAFPVDAVGTVRRVNRLDFEDLARDLLALRGGVPMGGDSMTGLR
jgi:ADP-ribosylglycohydrolase